MRVRFNDFVLDTDRRELLRGESRVPLRPKALQLLEVLIAQRPKAVSQQELSDRLWPETFVDKNALHKLMHQLREALGDDEQTTIRTVYGDSGTANPTFGQLAAVGTSTNAIPAFANVDPPRMFQLQVRLVF